MTSRALWLAAGALVAMIAFGIAAAQATRPTPQPPQTAAGDPGLAAPAPAGVPMPGTCAKALVPFCADPAWPTPTPAAARD